MIKRPKYNSENLPRHKCYGDCWNNQTLSNERPVKIISFDEKIEKI
jgi:hypothetical protein